jgi:hypothetical protein
MDATKLFPFGQFRSLLHPFKIRTVGSGGFATELKE